MISDPDHAVTRKKLKRLKRSGYSDADLYESAIMHERNYVRTIISSNCPSSSDTENDSEDSDDDEEEDYDYISLFQVCMNFLFPRAFRPQPVHRFIKSVQSVSDLKERSTGKILTPVGRCSLFPQGVFVHSTTENDVTQIFFPNDKETFMASGFSSRPSRSHKHTS